MFKKLEKIEEPVEKIINIFDFDGTLFNSPNPNPDLWDKSMFGKLRSSFNDNGYGWYQNTATLDDKYISSDLFNDGIVEDARKSIVDPNTITVMLTGRSSEYTTQIKKILSWKGLVFDEYGLKDDDKEHTFDFKKRYILNLVRKYGASGVQMWDDRIAHVSKFDGWLSEIKLNKGVHHVQEGNYTLPRTLELELVDRLMNDPRVNHNHTTKKNSYTALVLDPKSKKLLIDMFIDKIPEGWKIYAHHMTIAFGKPTPTTHEYITNFYGKQDNIFATHFGILYDNGNPCVLAVKVDGISNNATPHITIAVANGHTPKESNDITEWTELPKDIELSGTIF